MSTRFGTLEHAPSTINLVHYIIMWRIVRANGYLVVVTQWSENWQLKSYRIPEFDTCTAILLSLSIKLP